MTISANEPLNRALIRAFPPSLYPLVTGDSGYDTQKSFRIDVFSPSNTTTSNINLKVFFLVIQSDFSIDRFHSVNVSNSRDLDFSRTGNGVHSDQFDGGKQIKIRQAQKEVVIIQIRNTDGRPYLAEPIMNFTLDIWNFTQRNITNSTGQNITIVVPIDTVRISIFPYMNDGFFRVLLVCPPPNLYQDPAPLQTRLRVRTLYRYNLNPAQIDLPLWVFPQTPPNFLNEIINTTYLRPNQTRFQPATKITFFLQLRHNNVTYLNDFQSAQRIRVFRRSVMEQV